MSNKLILVGSVVSLFVVIFMLISEAEKSAGRLDSLEKNFTVEKANTHRSLDTLFVNESTENSKFREFVEKDRSIQFGDRADLKDCIVEARTNGIVSCQLVQL